MGFLRFQWFVFVDWLRRCLGGGRRVNPYGAPLDQTRGDRYADPDLHRHRFTPATASRADEVYHDDDQT